MHGSEAAGPAGGIDQGHLPTPHDQKPGHRTRGRRPVPVESRLRRRSSAAPTSVESLTSVKVAKPARTPQVILCGALQLLIFLGYGFLAALLIVQGFKWISAAQVCLTSTCGRSFPAAQCSSTCSPFRSWRSGSSSVAGSPGRSASGAWRTSASGSSRRWSSGTRLCCSRVRRCSRSTCGRWARRSGAAL